MRCWFVPRVTADAPTVRALLADATRALTGAGVASPRVDAELLLAHVLGVPRGALIVAPPPIDSQARAMAALVARRIAREPLQYLLGTAAFRHLELAVGPGVFIPRPETELLVDAVRPALDAVARPVVVDLCAGSGALGLAVHQEWPAAQVLAVERSPDALRWLRRNADALAGDGRFTIVAGDIADPALLTDPDLGQVLGGVDVVLCNPPYVPERAGVGAEVRHDPPEAVFAGADGLALMPAVAALAAALLRPGGTLVVEHSEGHAAALLALFAADAGWESTRGHTDLAGCERFVTTRRGARSWSANPLCEGG